VAIIEAHLDLSDLIKYLSKRSVIAVTAAVVAGLIAGVFVTKYYVDANRILEAENERDRTQRDSERIMQAAQREADAARQETQNAKNDIADLKTQIVELRETLAKEKLARETDDSSYNKIVNDLQGRLKKYERDDKSKKDQASLKSHLLAVRNPILGELFKYLTPSCAADLENRRYVITSDGCLVFHNKYFIAARHPKDSDGHPLYDSCIVAVKSTDGDDPPGETSFEKGRSQLLRIGEQAVRLIYLDGECYFNEAG
jgi:hypothetical protein